MVCEVLSYRPFDTPVPFKSDTYGYLEVGGSRRGYFQPGVRRISLEEHDAILKRAMGGLPEKLAQMEGSEARGLSALRMAKVAAQTADYSKGQIVERTVKRKDLDIGFEDLVAYIEDLIERQNGRCALSGLELQFDAVEADVEALVLA
ncbi:hypothetical protein [Bradyrhizobium sp. I71]|uniref:hypothetical protein n=1 Tax=Bradyrhizobium sp. I71 TaxID=2590772 RepID=UPI001EF8B639|nr:hypothetical protein [Bradyrhizobium sp. I71]ULL01227.1 hypothetical protein FJV43_16385 [Bradyrhizobium sp. I71]